MFRISADILTEPASQMSQVLDTITPDTHDKSYAVASFLLKVVDWVLKPLGLESDKTAVIIVYAAVVFAVSLVVGYITQWIVLGILRRYGEKLNSNLYHSLHSKNFFLKLCRVIPALVFLILIQFTLVTMHSDVAQWLTRLTLIYVIFVIGSALVALIGGIWLNVDTHRNTRRLPLSGLVQLIQGIIWIIALIIAVAVLADKSPASLLAGLGAFAAVLMLVFKDSILGVVAGVQLSENDSLHVGDWIKINGTDANGTVAEVTLTSVKVLNWDKTTTCVPPYSLVSGSFTNYRTMQLSNTRRIQRSYTIDADSIKPTTPEMLDAIRKVPFMDAFITKKLAQKAAGKVEDINNSEGLVDGTIDTNLGLFRAYMKMWLDASPYVSHTSDCFVSTLPQTGNGVPFQIYCFTSTSSWFPYEAIMDTMFEHLAAMLAKFELTAFQAPTDRGTILEGYINGKDPDTIFGLPEPFLRKHAQQ
ncbi:MAG: mechanosensitive ion channel family protein [Muribaculum sp.]|nr:mechanosensitive ion channel family protein [Muribaculum sp.]